MTLRLLLIVAAIVFVIFGLGLLLVPAQLMAPYGVALDPAGELMGRLGGQALIGLAIAFWYARDTDVKAAMSPAMKGVLYGGCTFNIIGFIVALWATLTGQMGPGGWIAVAIHAVIGAGFLYYADFSRRAAMAA